MKLLYRGSIPAIFNSSITLATFFAISSDIEKLTINLYHLKPGEKEKWYITGTSAIATGMVVSVISAPFDIIKTHSQMPGTKDFSFFKGLENNFKFHGFSGFTVGMGLKFLQKTVGWGINSMVMQNLKKSSIRNREVEKLEEKRNDSHQYTLNSK